MGDDLLFGQGANDLLYGHAGDDYAEGNSGDDAIYGGLGQDDLIGGSAQLDLPDGVDDIWGGDNAGELAGDFDVIAGDNASITRPTDAQGRWRINSFNPAIMRTVTLLDIALAVKPEQPASLSGNDRLHGEAGDDRLYGQGGDDQIWAGAGDDYAEGNSASDLIWGERGQNDLVGGSAQVGVRNAGDAIWGGDSATELAGDFDMVAGDNAIILRPLSFGRWQTYFANGSIRRSVILLDLSFVGAPADQATAAGDVLNGEGADDLLYGQGADDRIWGGAGDDYAEGNSGSDQLVGGAGADDLIGGGTARAARMAPTRFGAIETPCLQTATMSCLATTGRSSAR